MRHSQTEPDSKTMTQYFFSDWVIFLLASPSLRGAALPLNWPLHNTTCINRRSQHTHAFGLIKIMAYTSHGIIISMIIMGTCPFKVIFTLACTHSHTWMRKVRLWISFIRSPACVFFFCVVVFRVRPFKVNFASWIFFPPLCAFIPRIILLCS